MMDKKKAISAILLKLSAKPKESEEESESEVEEQEEPSEEMDLEVAAEEILSAIEKKDAKRLAKAMKLFIKMC
jgi:tRNA A37 N6-isopentenylltransferase MiaA